ncbi:hypothetical protein [Nocardia sp. NPDC050406]|uniref:hypothetical protein n=1 Tax=Nocardia sp. NPDC050406 TaxID=3364318 RepID=UPI0037ACF367
MFNGSEHRRGFWRRFGIVVLLLTCIAAPASYASTKTYFLGEKVSAQISECHWNSGGRKSRGSTVCTGTWVLKNGAKGSGVLRGIEQRYPAQVTVRATAKHAIADNGPWAPATFTVGVLAIIATVWLAVRWLRRRLTRDEVDLPVR